MSAQEAVLDMVDDIDAPANAGTSSSNLMKATGIIGKATGFAGAAVATYNAWNNPTTGNIVKAVCTTGLSFMRINPIVGLAIGIADATGMTDGIYNGIGDFIDTQTNGTSGNIITHN